MKDVFTIERDTTMRFANERTREVQRQQAERTHIQLTSVGMDTVPLQAPDLAIAELERLVNSLGMRGVVISSILTTWARSTRSALSRSRTS